MSESAGKAVFLSYASQDAEAARRLAATMRGAGIEVWLDQEGGLVGGDAWDRKIRDQIATCALFMPVVSASTQARREGYFRLEWKLADERTHLMAEGTPFLLPVVIDQTKDREALVPKSFLEVQWTRLPEGEASAVFVAHVQKMLGASPAPAISGPPPIAAAPGPKSSPRHWVAAVVGASVLALLGYVILRPGAKDAVSAGAVAATKPAAPAPSAVVSSPAAANVADKSIAVLPFANRSVDAENEFFTDGIHEDILTHLAHIRELRVVSRTSVMEYRGMTKKIPQIARELNVAYVLEGSVQRAGRKVRVTGQLIRAATDEHVWAQNYDRDLTDIFAIQSELAQAIAAELKTALSPQERSLIDRRPTENLTAYDHYLKARELSRQWLSSSTDLTLSGSVRDIQALLEQAVAADPKFAEAWAELARTHAVIYFRNTEHTAARLASARSAIDTAVRLAPESPDVIRNLGNFHLYGHRDYGRAAEQFERLTRLRPNDAEVLAALSELQQRRGRWQEALASIRKATQLEPGNIGFARSLRSLLQGIRRWDEAIVEQRRIVGMLPGTNYEAWKLAYLHFESRGSRREPEAFLARFPPDEEISLRKLWTTQSGNYAEAIRLNREHPSNAESTSPYTNVAAAMTLVAGGDEAGARALSANRPAVLRSRLQAEPNNFDLWWALGLMEAILGHKEEALRCARRTAEMIPESLDAVAGAQVNNKLALVYAWAGEPERALELSARMLGSPFSVTTVHLMRHDPWWFPLRRDPRFLALLDDPKNNAPLF